MVHSPATVGRDARRAPPASAGAGPTLSSRAGAALRLAAAAAIGLAVANCSSPQQFASFRPGVDSKYGVAPSRRLYGENDAIPKGGGRNFTGRPYVIAGRTYVPKEDPRGYVREGLASWYGSAFHGRETANGEVFDRFSVAAAHPTLPLPSYARVTNLANGHSMIVRVNDRGPYHENRVMDVSQRVAEALDFRRAGTTRVRVEYVGKASLRGSDDTKLMATLRTDGRGAPLPGQGSVMFAESDEAPAPRPTRLAAAPAPEVEEERAEPAPRPVAPRPAAPAPVRLAAAEADEAPPVRPALAFRPVEVAPAPQRRLALAAPPPASTAPGGAASRPAAHEPTIATLAARAAEARPPLRLSAPPLQLTRALPERPVPAPAPPVRTAALARTPMTASIGKAAAPVARFAPVARVAPVVRAKVAEAR